VPSAAFATWASERRGRLDALYAALDDAAEQPVRAEQIRWSLVLRLAGEFQGYARDLHDGAVDTVLRAVAASAGVRVIVRAALTDPRKLDRANAGATTLDHDFTRLGVPLTRTLRSGFAGGAAWLAALDRLVMARNGIAHSDRGKILRATGGAALDLTHITAWDGALVPLVHAMDSLTADTLATMTGKEAPW
jgi:hypothetical protein